MSRRPAQDNIDKCLFGILDDFATLFCGFCYSPTIRHGAGQGTSHPRPEGFYFLGGGHPGHIETFLRDKDDHSLAAKPHPHLVPAIENRCNISGRIGSFCLNTWQHLDYTLITATDREGISEPWVGWVETRLLPAINSGNTPFWRP